MEARKTIRLQKFIANCGLCSRREAEDWVRQGIVTVNNKEPNLGAQIDPTSDRVCVNGQVIRSSMRAPLVLAMNKPRGILCSHNDPYHEQTIFDLLPKDYTVERLLIAGRLDKESEGLVILTNDGHLANQVMHPSQGIIKRYQVTLNRAFDSTKIPQLLQGVHSLGERLAAQKVIPRKNGPAAERLLEVHLQQGRKREIRRMFAALGYFVKRLKRIQIGNYPLKRIALGDIRRLDEKDIKRLLS